MSTKDNGTVREFGTGATRSSASGRIDPEGFLSPLAVERYCQYLLKHQVQADGTVRDSDNWQKGMPLTTYIKGMWRHFLHFWTRHRGWEPMDDRAGVDIQEDLCAIIFNAQGYLHELLRLERKEIAEEEMKAAFPLMYFRPGQVFVAADPATPIKSVASADWAKAEDDLADFLEPDREFEGPGCKCCEAPGYDLKSCPYCEECPGGRFDQN